MEASSDGCRLILPAFAASLDAAAAVDVDAALVVVDVAPVAAADVVLVAVDAPAEDIKNVLN